MDLKVWVQRTTLHILVVILVTLDMKIKTEVSPHFDFSLNSCFNLSYNNEVKLCTI